MSAGDAAELERALALQESLVVAITEVDARGGFAYANEYDLQDALAAVFDSAGIPVVRELIFQGSGKRIDFYAPIVPDDVVGDPRAGVGIEVKIGGAFGVVYRQLRGYAAEHGIRALILVTTRPSRHAGMPRIFQATHTDPAGARTALHVPLEVVGLTGAAL